jgi:hypothetical protein
LKVRHAAARSDTMTDLDLAKRDMTVAYGGRTFALRAYREDGTWHGIIIEDKTPLHSWLGPAAVGFVAAVVDAAVAPREDSP